MKKCLLSLAFTFAVASANASYLYWQVDSESITGLHDYTHAVVYAKSGNDLVSIDSYSDTAGFASSSSPVLSVDLSTFEQDFSTSGWSFYIELYNYHNSENPSIVGHTTTPVAYSDLASSGAILDPGLPVGMNVWHGTPYSVPEPTSGLLMMLGFALVGLRRRKV